MKEFWKRFFPALPVLLVLWGAMFSHSCANTSQAPTGGRKDTIPPVLVKMNPRSYVIGVPVKGAKFTFTFDEYFKVSNPRNIFLSPPQKTMPKYRVKGKSLIITFEEPLEENTTYTLNFYGALQDNNENNPYPGYAFVFSTGDSIDSMYVTGSVVDCSTLDPIKDATVLLYTSQEDSAVFNELPVAATKTDEWGYFCIRNISKGPFRMYAVSDLNNNNRYDPDTEQIAFIDSLVTPVNAVRDSVYELMFFDMKDTTSCRDRKVEYELSMFRETPSRQFIKNHGRKTERSAFISFNARNAHIDTMWIAGVSPDRLITQINLERDSLEMWINDQRSIPDTVNLFVNYLKTDSLGVLSGFTEEIRLGNENPRKVQRYVQEEIKHTDTICVFKLNADPKTVELDGFSLEFEYPIINAWFDSVKYIVTNPRNQEEEAPFTYSRDTLDVRKYKLIPQDPLLPGHGYTMKIPQGVFRDINNHWNDSTEVSVSLPSDANLSTLQLEVTNVHHKYIIDMQDERKSSIIRSYIVTEDRSLVFPYLTAGKYYIRITEDLNENSYVDSGSLLDHQMPERVKYMKINDNPLLDIPAMSFVTQSVDIGELF
ncbi:MAG: Ig-like domain-containing protein [Bacteroidales bacterium]|nr:Ig-like domain-containing protein [Bacteroidales bacterium]